MKKYLLLISLIAVLSSCTSQRQIMDTWIGKTKQSLLLSWGPPTRTSEDGNNGQILVYANKLMLPNGQQLWDYSMMYVNSEGTIYHWRTSREAIPPTQVNVTFTN